MRAIWHKSGYSFDSTKLPQRGGVSGRVDVKDRTAHYGVLDAVNVPALAAGGIATARAMAAALAAGADGVKMARQSLEAAGAVEILDSGPVTPAYHLMGTARMGADPRRSVVNASHRAHDVPNLYVVDRSSFATSAAVNPTSTIGALALRPADQIWAEQKS